MKKIFGILLALALTLGFSLVMTTPVSADPGTTYYVATTGSDETGTGSWWNPWKTIQHAVGEVASGDTIMVAPGEYAGAIVDKDVTISGTGSGASVIASGVPYKVGGGLGTAFRLDAGADGAEISNFTISNNQSAGFYFAVFSRAIDGVTIDSLEINDTVQGITNWGGSGWTITSNTITDTVAAGGGGIGIFLGATPPNYRICSDNLVQYNEINASATAEAYSCPGICLALDLRYGAYGSLNGTEEVSGNQILNNIITASGANNGIGIEVGVIGLEGDPDKIAAIMTAAPVHGNTVQENTADGADTGIYFYNVSDLTINHNTIENSVSYGIYADDGQSGTVITGNTFTNNEIQLADETDDTETLDPLDIASILNNNTFDRAVTVDHPGASLLHTIWSSIQDAIDEAAPGDTIDVAAGTYTESLTITDKGLTITGESESGVIVQAGTTAPGSSNVFTINAAGKNITIQNMTIRNGLYGIRSTAGDVNVLHCTFYHNGYDGYPYDTPPTQENASDMWESGHTTNGGAMRIQDSGSSEIAYCTAYENARGIRFQDGNNGNIHNCVSYDNIDSGLYLASSTYNGNAGCTNTVIRDCQSYGNMNNGILVVGGKNITVENNNVHDNWNTGIMLWHPSEVVIENNTITHNNLYSFNGVGNPGDAEGGIWMVGATAMTPLDFVCKISHNTISDTQPGRLAQKVGVNVGDVYDSSIVIEHNTFSDHDIDVWVQYQAATTAVNCNSFGTDYGIKNDDTSATLDGQYNWWGDASGPYHATTNPSGTGDCVSDNVDYSPWWGANYIGVAHPWDWYTNDSIQDAVDAASAGDTINVMAGTYQEQVVINKNLTLQGTSNPVIKAPGSPGAFTFPESGASWEPVVFAFGGNNTGGSISGTETITVDISGFTVDGNDRVPTGRSAGILLRNAGGTVSDSTIHSMYVDGKQTFGIMVYGDSSVTIVGNDVTGYARGGIGANGDSVTSSPSYPTPHVVIEGNTVNGPGMEVPVTWAPNGIQIGWGATGEIVGNNVTGNGWPGTDWSGSGIIVAGADSVDVDGNTVEDNETGIAICGWMWDSAGVTADGTWIHNNTVHGNTYGISIQDKSVDTTIEYNSVTNSTYDGVDICNFYGYAPTGTLILYNTITGNNAEDDATSGGIWIDDGVDGNEVTVNFNKIASNNRFGILNTSTTNDVDATYNWWGDASGPYHETENPDGLGNAVSDNVDFKPWYGDEEMTILEPHSTYKFAYVVPDVIVVCEETVVPVTFETDELGYFGYDGVRFSFNATGPGDVIFKATDSEEVEHTFTNSGYWGPPSGFPLPPDYSATTDWTLNFTEPGEYTITFSLIEAPDGEVIADIEASEVITVRVEDIQDYYRHLNEPYDEVTTDDLLAAIDDWIADVVPPGFEEPISTPQLLELIDEWLAT